MHWIFELLSMVPTGRTGNGWLANLPWWQQLLWILAISGLILAVTFGIVLLINN